MAPSYVFQTLAHVPQPHREGTFEKKYEVEGACGLESGFVPEIAPTLSSVEKRWSNSSANGKKSG
jgi:hypothetical protein